MKIINWVPSLILSGSLLACSQVNPIPPDQIAANLAPIVKIEKQASQLKYYTQVLGSIGKISEENSASLKTHYDTYYVYWTAAIVHLSTGKMDSYLAHVKMAERELNAIERILKDKFAEIGKVDSQRPGRFSGLGL